MAEYTALRIHARLRPTEQGTHDSEPQWREGEPIRIEAPTARPARRPRKRRARSPMTRGDRLLRNTAIACAALLGVLALGNVDQPWARKASDSIERALTMRIDLDDSLGALEFVRDWMPESTLVFMNLSATPALARPVDGAVSHSWMNAQPWLMFTCGERAEVRAAQDGTVTAVSALSDGKCGILIDHGDGIETVYAYLTSANVEGGDAVARGQVIGTADDSLYFEYRCIGESIDPADALGL